MSTQRLSAYRLVNIPATGGFDAAIKADVIDDLAQFDIDRPDFAAKLFVQSSEPKEPVWAAFLQEGFPNAQFVSSASASALAIRSREVVPSNTTSAPNRTAPSCLI